MSVTPQINPLAKLTLISKLKNYLSQKIKAIDSWFETLRCNIYISELVANELYSVPNNILTIQEQEALTFEILNALFSYNNQETIHMKAQIEYLYSNNLVKKVTIASIEQEIKPFFGGIFKKCFSKKNLTTQQG